MPSSPITRKDVEARPILYVQQRVVRTDLQPMFAKCFPKVYSHAVKAGLSIAGQPIARYVSAGAGLWTVDCAIPLLEPASSNGEMEVSFLQAGPGAFAVHSGDYELLLETNEAIGFWIEENGFRSNGPPWESYVTSPVDHPNVADWKTEVYWPIAE